MSDRELIESVAKVYGLKDCVYINEVGMWKRGERPWNPLKDDGDALRLAAYFDLEIYPTDSPGVACCTNGADTLRTEYHGTDRMAAIRRAIVRAAHAEAIKRAHHSSESP